VAASIDSDCVCGIQVERLGPQHQAGSDSLLTGATFFKMREVWTTFLLGLRN